MNRRSSATIIALGGVFTALAVTIMVMGTWIPVATYTCPVLCILLGKFIYVSCGKKIAWAWYGAVAILSLLLAPDKEAALIYLFLGYYPIIKPWMDQRKGKWGWKLSYFNGSVLIAYWLMLNVLGLDQVAEDLAGIGMIFTILLLLMANVVFILLDKILYRRLIRKIRPG